MSMTGGTAKQVKTGTPSGWPGSIKLYVYYKVKSQSIANNTTTLSLGMYITTPSGYWLEAWADNRGSYVGTATSGSNCKTFDGSLPYKTEGTYWIAENKEVTVSHNADGTKKATIYWKWGVYSSWGGFTNPSGSFEVTLPAIPRVSGLTVPASGTLGNALALSISPASSGFRHKLTYKVGNATGTILDQSSSATSVNWTPPAALASENTSGKSLTCTFTLTTYTSASASDSVGTATGSTTLTIPSTADYCPAVSATFATETAVPNGTLDILLQNKGRVKATFTATMKYGATIKTSTIAVDGTNNSVSGSSPLQSGILTTAGNQAILLTVTDSRGNQTILRQEVTVYAYKNPTIGAADGEKEIRAERCDEYGDFDPGGTFLRIKAKAGYTAVSGNTGVTLQYRWKPSNGSYSGWSDVADQDTGAISGVYLDPKSAYVVDLRAVDTYGYSTTTIINIGTEAVWSHKTATGMSYGAYAVAGGFEVTWDASFYGNVHGMVLGLGGLPKIPEGGDVNSYVTPGAWGIDGYTLAQTILNLPVEESGTLRVWNGLGRGTHTGPWVYMVQEYINYNGTRRFLRGCHTEDDANQWIYGSWVEK